MRCLARFLGALSIICSGLCNAAVIDAQPDNYVQKLPLLVAGDTLRLAPGVYRAGLKLHHLSGSAGQPIVIEGRSNLPAIFLGRPAANTVSIVDSRFIVLRNLVFNGLNAGGEAVKAEGYAHFAHDITLENLRIINHGGRQAIVAISTHCPAWNWIIRGNRIIRPGTGLYLGNSDGTAPFVGGLIEHNAIINPIGYGMQIKHQLIRPELAGMPTGISSTIIRDNLFVKAKNFSTGKEARPNLLVGHFPPSGAGRDDRYEVYRNVFLHNPSEALFQGEGNIALYNNLFVNVAGNAIHIQPHNDVPKQIDIFHNTVIASGKGILLRNGFFGPTHKQKIVANLVFAAEPVSGGEQAHNIVGGRELAGRYLRAPFGTFAQLRLDPIAGRLPLPDVDLGWMQAFTDADRDIDGRLLGLGYIGAYAKEAVRPLPFSGTRQIR